MQLVIQIQDGKPFEHPILVSNLLEVMPEIDINNLPPQFAHFQRVEFPNVGPYKQYMGSTYEWVDGIVKDVHHMRDLTPEEIVAKQEAVKKAWNNKFPSWTFSEELCCFLAPVPYPNDGRAYKWNEETLSWVYFLEAP